MNKKYFKQRLSYLDGVCTDACINRDNSMAALEAIAEKEYLEYRLGQTSKKAFQAFVKSTSSAAQTVFATLAEKYGEKS
jgi:hypothetical protein